MKYRLPLVTTFMLMTACERSPFAVSAGSGNWLTEQRVAAPSADISVMTQNLYVGADVDLVIRALATPNPNDDFAALMFAIETVGKTDFPARAQAIGPTPSGCRRYRRSTSTSGR